MPTPTMRVPLLDLATQHAPLKQDLLAATARCIDSGMFVLGPEVIALEEEVARLTGRAHGVGVTSGSDALLATLMALGVEPGDEVVTTAFSFFATVGAIVRLGARPIFADIDDTLNLDPADARAKVTKRTKVVLPVSLFGRRPDLAALQQAGPILVEDGAQAIGARGLGEGVRAATLSFFPSKNLGALGDGGMVLTDDARLAERLRLLRQHGSHPKYVHSVVGGNFRLDALQAALLRVKLPHLEAWNAARAVNARRLSDGLAPLAREGLLGLPEDSAGRVWHHYVVRVVDDKRPSTQGRREALRQHLAARGVDSEVYYPLALHMQPCFVERGWSREGDCPRAEAAAREVLALPIHPALSEAQVDHVAASVKSFFDGSST